MWKRALVVTVAAIVGAVVVFFAGEARLIKFGERPETTIVLRMVSGACQPSDPLPLVRKTGRVVTWRIRNECDGPHDVRFRNFRQKNDDGTLGSPETVTEPAEPGGTIGAAGGVITAPLTKNKEELPRYGAIYKYEIWLAPQGGTLERGRDPDLEIWP